MRPCLLLVLAVCVASAEPEATCARACEHMARCGVTTKQQCIPQCERIKPTPSALAAAARSTCDQIRAVWKPKDSTPPRKPQPTARWGCNSMGMYRECQHGVCSDRMAYGYGIGATEAAARISAAANCQTHILNMIMIAGINGGAQVRDSCKTTSCSGPR